MSAGEADPVGKRGMLRLLRDLVVGQLELCVKAELGVIPTGAVLQAEGGISRVLNSLCAMTD